MKYHFPEKYRKYLDFSSLILTMADGGRRPKLIACTVEKRGNMCSNPRSLRTSCTSCAVKTPLKEEKLIHK